jgi:hypothetical protein
LEELDAKEHRDPCELESGPDGEDDGEGVFVEDLAEVVGENGALDVFRCVAVLEVWCCQLLDK